MKPDGFYVIITSLLFPRRKSQSNCRRNKGQIQRYHYVQKELHGLEAMLRGKKKKKKKKNQEFI